MAIVDFGLLFLLIQFDRPPARFSQPTELAQEQKTQITTQQQQMALLEAKNTALQENILALETRLEALERQSRQQ